MWLEDSRFPKRRGTLVTKFVSRSGDVSAAALEIPGNGARVSLLIAAVPNNTGTTQSSISIGPRQSGQVRPLRVLTPGVAHCALNIDRDGDVVMGPLSIIGTAEWNDICVYEVVFTPEG